MNNAEKLQLIGLEVCQAEVLLRQTADTFKFIYYTDRKQNGFDKHIVTSVKTVDGVLLLTVCPMQFAVAEND